MNKLEQALMFLRKGISVIPLRHRGKEPESSLMGGTWERYKTELPTEYQVRNWLFSTWQNYGVVAGWRNLAILDFDQWDAYELWKGYFDLLNKHVEVYPMPYIVKTSRGAHVYLSMPGGGVNEKRKGVDVKFHGYVVGPGSIHPSGAEYTPITEFRLIDVYSLETILPEDLYPRVKEIAPSASCGQICTNFTDLSQPVNANSHNVYDPYQLAAKGNNVDLISKVKSTARIENFFSHTIKTSIDGRWLAAQCFFHDDQRPSMWIDTKKQICGCQVCNMKPMDVVNLYGRIHNLNNADAISALASELGIWR